MNILPTFKEEKTSSSRVLILLEKILILRFVFKNETITEWCVSDKFLIGGRLIAGGESGRGILCSRDAIQWIYKAKPHQRVAGTR